MHPSSRLPTTCSPLHLQNTVVVDPSGAWLTGWEARHERLAAPHVRTPNTQHPHASPLALPDFAVKHERQQVGCTGLSHVAARAAVSDQQH